MAPDSRFLGQGKRPSWILVTYIFDFPENASVLWTWSKIPAGCQCHEGEWIRLINLTFWISLPCMILSKASLKSTQTMSIALPLSIFLWTPSIKLLSDWWDKISHAQNHAVYLILSCPSIPQNPFYSTYSSLILGWPAYSSLTCPCTPS